MTARKAVGSLPKESLLTLKINNHKTRFMNSFTIWSGDTYVDWAPKLVSTALTANAMLRWNGSGYLTQATDAAGQNPFAGVGLRTVASTDSDYASATKIPFVVPASDTIFLAPVVTGTLTAAMVGTYCDLASTGVGIKVTTTAQVGILIVGFISATQALVKINSAAQWKPGA